MNRRNLLKTFLAAPAIIRSGVLMPVVPLVAAPLSGIAVLRQHEILTGTEVLRRQAMLDDPLAFQADRVWVQDHAGRNVYDSASGPIFYADPSPHVRRLQQSHHAAFMAAIGVRA
jgi:hypothetical protein